MKIAMLGHKHMPSRAGGVEVVVDRLSRELVKRGHSVVCFNRSGFGPKENNHGGVELVTVPAWGKGGLGAVTASFFAALLAAFRDVQTVHFHGEGPAFFSALPRLAGKRVVVTIHGLDWKREKWQGSFGPRFLQWGERAAVRNAHCMIVLSRQAQTYFRERYSRETVYIPNGVGPLKKEKADKILALGLKEGEYGLFLGRLVPEKGVHTLIRAWKKAGTGKKLVIAGPSSDTEAYVKECRQLASDDPDILFPGFVEGTLLAELYSNAWVYVLPSSLEGMPLGLLEAMGYGCCCITSDIPECTEVLSGAGLTVPPGDEEALTQLLRELAREPQRLTAFRAAAQMRSGGYSWETMTERTLECYRENSAGK